MFGSDNFPLGPAGKFPKQRIGTSGEMLVPVNIQDIYADADSKLPVLEKDFTASVEGVKNRMKNGCRHKNSYMKNSIFRPRYAPNND